MTSGPSREQDIAHPTKSVLHWSLLPSLTSPHRSTAFSLKHRRYSSKHRRYSSPIEKRLDLELVTAFLRCPANTAPTGPQYRERQAGAEYPECSRHIRLQIRIITNAQRIPLFEENGSDFLSSLCVQEKWAHLLGAIFAAHFPAWFGSEQRGNA
jgi:hypothetical protein